MRLFRGAVASATFAISCSLALAQQSDWYLMTQLGKFKSGMRGTHKDDVHGQQMRAMSMTLPDEQAMKDVIAFIMTLSKTQAAK